MNTQNIKELSWIYEIGFTHSKYFKIIQPFGEIAIAAVILIFLCGVWLISMDVPFVIDQISPDNNILPSPSTQVLSPADYVYWVGQSLGLTMQRVISPSGWGGAISGILIKIIAWGGGWIGVWRIRSSFDRAENDIRIPFRLNIKAVKMMYDKSRALRLPVDACDQFLVDAENNLRKSCYHKHGHDIDNGFLDDSDMSGPYYLVVAFLGNEQRCKMVASARFYSTRKDIQAELQNAKSIDFSRTRWKLRRFHNQHFCTEIEEGRCCLVDRLANNEDIKTARGGKTIELQTAAFASLYKTILDHSPGQTYFAGLARMGRNEQLLHRYLPLGLRIQGICDYKVGKESQPHWIVGNTRENLQKYSHGQIMALQFIWEQKR